jgi:hypothetical protein
VVHRKDQPVNWYKLEEELDHHELRLVLDL